MDNEDKLIAGKARRIVIEESDWLLLDDLAHEMREMSGDKTWTRSRIIRQEIKNVLIRTGKT